jgi:hypothetical protein
VATARARAAVTRLGATVVFDRELADFFDWPAWAKAGVSTAYTANARSANRICNLNWFRKLIPASRGIVTDN